MLKKVALLAIVSIFLFSSLGAYAADSTSKSASATSSIAQPTTQPLEKTKDRASRGMNNLLYGSVEVPKNLDESSTKGTKVERCTEKTRSGVERGIARIFTGAWQLATFWYSDPGCVTSTAQATQKAASTKTKK